MNFENEMKRYANAAETALAKHLPNADGSIVAKAMEYSVMGGGKRLRPVIILASAEAFGGTVEEAAAFAVAVEMIHTYSLVHDDLPAMDDDDYRRGRFSCHKKFGEANGILAGDGLLNRAYEVMLGAILARPGENRLKAAAAIARAAGIEGMISGQGADIAHENMKINEETLVWINERKTGAMISASFEAGAYLGGASDTAAEAFAKAGMKIGTAFQIRDDVLDIKGSFESLGKLTGSDERNNKVTYASLLGEERCAERILRLTAEACKLLNSTKADCGFLVWLAEEMANRTK